MLHKSSKLLWSFRIVSLLINLFFPGQDNFKSAGQAQASAARAHTKSLTGKSFHISEGTSKMQAHPQWINFLVPLQCTAPPTSGEEKRNAFTATKIYTHRVMLFAGSVQEAKLFLLVRDAEKSFLEKPVLVQAAGLWLAKNDLFWNGTPSVPPLIISVPPLIPSVSPLIPSVPTLIPSVPPLILSVSPLIPTPDSKIETFLNEILYFCKRFSAVDENIACSYIWRPVAQNTSSLGPLQLQRDRMWH